MKFTQIKMLKLSKLDFLVLNQIVVIFLESEECVEYNIP